MLMNSLFVASALISIAVATAAAPDDQLRITPPRAAAVADDDVRANLQVLAARGCIDSVEDWATELAPGTRVSGNRAATLLRKLAGLSAPVASTEEAISQLAARRVITSPAFWRQHAVADSTCSADDLAVVVRRVVARFWKPIPLPASFAAPPLQPLTPRTMRDRYDVVIAGAGTGGCGAAVQAARMGCSVLLVEETDLVGGQAFAAGVTSMDEGKPLIRERGLYRELCGLIQAHYAPLGVDFVTAYWQNTPAAEPHVGRDLLLRMLGHANTIGAVDLVTAARVTKVHKQGNAVEGVDIETLSPPSFTRPVSCSILIDATEWGDVIPLTGARYRTGNCTSDAVDERRQVQQLTWTAVVKRYAEGVPTELRVSTPPPGYAVYLPRFRTSVVRGEPGDITAPPRGTPWSWSRLIGYRGMPDSLQREPNGGITRTHLNFNNDHPVTVADVEDPVRRRETCRDALVKTLCLLHYVQTELGHDDWSVADDEGFDTPLHRAEIEELIAARPELATFRDVLRHFPVMPYVRESRRIIGVSTLRAREIERRPGTPVQFPDTVALADYAIDLHGSMTEDNLEQGLDRADDMPTKFGDRGLGPFAIPFRCFVPETIDGLLAAEKNISQSRLVNGATRLQPSTLNMGQAAGAIAALAVRQQRPPRAVDPADVQQVLLAAGCPLAIAPVSAPRGSEAWVAEQRAALGKAAPSARFQP